MSFGNELLVTLDHMFKPFNTASLTAPAEKNAGEFTANHFTQSNNTETSNSYCDAVLQSNH